MLIFAQFSKSAETCEVLLQGMEKTQATCSRGRKSGPGNREERGGELVAMVIPSPVFMMLLQPPTWSYASHVVLGYFRVSPSHAEGLQVTGQPVLFPVVWGPVRC